MHTKFSFHKLLLIAGIVLLQTAHAQNFVHPGLPWTINDLEQMKAKRSVYPWSKGWEQITNTEQASLNYRMQGPTVDVENGGNYPVYISDVNAVFYHALQWYFTGDEAHAELAISLIVPWVVTHKTWSGTSVHLHAAWRGGTLAQGCEILRHTYPGWTDELTELTEDYFLNVMWPQFRLPNPLRSANQGANNLMGAMYVAVYCNDQEKFDMCIDAFLNDACGGIQNSLPNGQHGDMGRDQGHAGAMTGNLATVCEVAWSQGVDLYAVLGNRMLTINEYWSKFNLGEEVDWVDHGTCYGYYTSMSEISRGPDQGFMLGTMEKLTAAYVLRKGIPAPYTTRYRDGLPITEETFLFRKDSSFLTKASFTFEPLSELIYNDVNSLTDTDVGSVGMAGSHNYNEGTWTVKGSGSDLDGGSSDHYHFVYQQMNGDGALIAKINSVENTNANAKAALVITETLASNSMMAGVAGRASSPDGSQFFSRGIIAGDGSGGQKFPLSTVPTWVKIERRGEHIVGYVGPDGKAWAPMQNTRISMSDDYFIGLGVSSHNNGALCTSVFTDVQLGVPDQNAVDLGAFSQIEAENFVAMAGIDLETSSDVSGGQDVVSINAGDWMQYEVNVPFSGTFIMDYRVAAADNSDFILTLGDDTLHSLTFSATGAADAWTTVQSATSFYLTKGMHQLKVTANSDDWKINWLRLKLACKDVPIVPYIEIIKASGNNLGELTNEISIYPGNTVVLKPELKTGGEWNWSGPDGFSSTSKDIRFDNIQVDQSGEYVFRFTNTCGFLNAETFKINVTDSLYIEAESYTTMDGVSIEATDDVSGDAHLSEIASGDWMEYELNVPFSAYYKVSYRIAGTSAGDFTTRIDGNAFEQINFDAGDWESYLSASPVYLKKGLHTLKITANSTGWKLNWLKLLAQDDVSPCGLPYENDGFEIKNETVRWSTGPLDISCVSAVNVCVKQGMVGTPSETDSLNVYYKLDGGEAIRITNNSGSLVDDFGFVKALSGNTLEIIVEGASASATDYYSISKIRVSETTDPFDVIEAEAYDAMADELDYYTYVSAVQTGGWSRYSCLDLTGVKSIKASVASESKDAYIEVRLDAFDGPLVGKIDVPDTETNTSFKTVSGYMLETTGIHDLYLVYKSEASSFVCNIDWLQLSASFVKGPTNPYDRFEAEINDGESGTVVSTTTDVDGLEQLGNLENGDYIMFSELNLEEADSLFARVASAVDGGVIEVRIGSKTGNIIAFVDVPNTGSSMTWQAVSAKVGRVKGVHDVYFIVRGEGNDLFKLNWLSFTNGIDGFDKLEVENNDSNSGGLLPGSTTDPNDDGAGTILRFIKPGSWVQFNNVDLTEALSVNARYSTANSDALIEVRLDAVDGELIGTVDLDNTDDWNNWETAGGGIAAVSGVHDVFFVYQTETSGVVCSSNWFQFSKRSIPNRMLPGARIEAEDYARTSGTVVAPTTDVDGEQELTSIQNNDWILFQNVDISDITGISARVANANETNQTIYFRLGAYDGDLFSFISVPGTGASSNWQTIDAVYIAPRTGVHDVYAIFKGSSSDVLNINWLLFKQSTVGITGNTILSEVQIYPNPFGEKLIVSNAQGSELNLYSLCGSLLMQSMVTKNNQEFDVTKLTPGTYILRITGNDKVLTSKIIKK